MNALHASAGAELAAAWHLPDEVIEACRWHHAPDGRAFPLLVAAADTLSRVVEARDTFAEARARLCDSGLSVAEADDLMARAAKEVQAPE